MRGRFLPFWCMLFCLIVTSLHAQGMYDERLVQIDLGRGTTKNQVWDGTVHVSDGSVIAVPFPIYSHNEFRVYNQRESKTSWKLITNFKNGGLYLKLRCHDDATITVYNPTLPFSFSLRDLRDGKELKFNGNNITVKEQTGTYFYARSGFEAGLYGEGTASIEPTTARVNEPGTWTIDFQVGESGIPVGGGIRVAMHHSRSWGKPQYNNPREENYITLKSSNNQATLDYTSLNAVGLLDWPYTKQIVLIIVKNKPLNPGDRVTITIGDTSKGSPGYRAAITNEVDVLFRVETCTQLNDNYFPIYRVIENVPRVEVLPEKAVRTWLVAPSVVEPGESFDMTVRMEDDFRNVATDYKGTLKLFLNGKELDRVIRLRTRDNGMLGVSDFKFDRPGVYQFTVEDSRNGITGSSNPIHCRDNPPYRLYWGEMHCHSYYSDGYGTRESLFTFLRDVALLDFAAITDHDVEADSNDYTLTRMWYDTQIVSKKFHQPGRFVTFPAWEWSPHRYAINGDHYYGDHNVFYAKEDPARKLLSAGSDEYHSSTLLYEGLYMLNDRAIVIPHVGGAVGQWDIHDDNWQPLGEIYSVHGSFEGWGQLALDKYHRKIGFIGGGDNHNGQGGGYPPSGVPGHSTQGGLAATYAKELTREGILEAMYARRTYATSGPRILIDVTMDSNLMGSDVEASGPPTLNVLAHGKDAIWKADIVKNGKVVHTWINDDVTDQNQVTVLWRNWLLPAGFDRNDPDRRFGIPRVNWTGELTVTGADIQDVTRRSFHHPKDAILAQDEHSVGFRTQTRGDWDGLTLSLNRIDRNVSLDFSSGPASFSLKPADMKRHYDYMKIDKTTEILVLRGSLANETVEFSYRDEDFDGDCYYYVRVTQVDGEEAWASPIYVTGR